MTNYFRDDNTEGYSAADLANLNDLYRAMCAAEGISTEDGEDDRADHRQNLGERILAEFDAGRESGIVEIGSTTSQEAR